MRGVDLLCTEPVLFFFSLWAAFSWGVLYLFFSIVPLVFTTNHNFTLEQNGAVFGGNNKPPPLPSKKKTANCVSFCAYIMMNLSNVRRRPSIYSYRRVSGEISYSLWQVVLDARSTALLELCAHRFSAHWTFLVRMDAGAAHSLDCAYDGDCVCDNGPVFYLPGSVELFDRHISPLR